jgi:hypothetical protein
MVLRPAPTSSTRLMWAPLQKRFIGEMSDLYGGFGRVWDDAADEGMTLISRYDDSEMVFVVDHEQRGEDDILWWDLRPVAGNRIVDRGFTIRIVND